MDVVIGVHGASTCGPIDEIAVTRVPKHFASAKVGFDQPALALEQHSQAVYGAVLGYPAEHIARLQAEGVI